MRLVLITVLLFSSTFIFSQIDQAVGEWRSFLPYKNVKTITQSDEQIIYGTQYSLMTIEKSDFSINFMSKVDGLSDVGISIIEYDQNQDQLIIIYENSNIDILKDGDVINIPTIKDNTTIIGSKQINHVLIENDIAYLSTNFGIVEFRLIDLQFGSTIFTGIPINQIASLDNYLYAATDDGVYYTENSNAVNIADFSGWDELLDDDLPGFLDVDHIIGYEGSLYLSSDEKLWKGRLNEGFEDLSDEVNDNHDITFMTPGKSGLILGMVKNPAESETLIIDVEGNTKIGGTGCIYGLYNAVEDEEGKYWYADEYGFRYSKTYNSGCQEININSPKSADGSDIDVKDGVVYVATGGANENYTVSSNRQGFFIYKDKEWRNYYQWNFPIIAENDYANVFLLAVSPNKNKLYLGSFYYKGIIEFDTETEEAILFNATNSALNPYGSDGDVERISGMEFDDDGNLWINNMYGEKPLVVYTNEGNWYSYNVPESNILVRLAIDQSDYIWNVIPNSSGGIIIYDHNNTINDPTDDRTKLINQNNSEITTGVVNCITVDRDGDVWVGTDEGPVVFNSGPSVFESDYPGNRLKVTQDGIAAYLLETEDVRAIEVDGANRKWIGTRNGIFVMSPSGNEQEIHYTAENSVLFDNNIVEMEFDGDNGLMYISSDKGIQSIRTETLDGKTRHDSQVYAFPNPVRPEYNGDIFIKGLANDADVKITDLNGKLVYETEALGGQAVWDGKDYNGRKAATGVYLVFSTGTVSFDTPEAYVTKIMVVN